MNDRESLAEAAKRRARENSFAAESRRVPAYDGMVEDGEGQVENCGCYGFLRGIRDRAMHLEFRRKIGPWPAPGYSWLVKPTYGPEGSIALLYASGDRVIIRGRNLRPIFQRILTHQVLWIEEQGQEWEGKGADGLTMVYEIDYQNSDAEGEGERQ